MYPERSMTLAMVRVEPRCGDRLAVCALHIACSQRLGSSEQNNNHKSGLSAECQGLFSGNIRQHTRGTLLSFAGKKCLKFQILKTGGALHGIKGGESISCFACWPRIGEDSLQVLGQWIQTTPRWKGYRWGNLKVFKSVYCSFQAFRTTTRAFLDIRDGVYCWERSQKVFLSSAASCCKSLTL